MPIFVLNPNANIEYEECDAVNGLTRAANVLDLARNMVIVMCRQSSVQFPRLVSSPPRFEVEGISLKLGGGNSIEKDVFVHSYIVEHGPVLGRKMTS